MDTFSGFQLSPGEFALRRVVDEGKKDSAKSDCSCLFTMSILLASPIGRSIKYEEVYLHAFASVNEARTSLSRYIHFYDKATPRSSLKAQTPDQVYFNRLPESMAA